MQACKWYDKYNTSGLTSEDKVFLDGFTEESLTRYLITEHYPFVSNNPKISLKQAVDYLKQLIPSG